MAPAFAVACLLAAALLSAATPAAAWGTGGWVDARATFYGQDAWALHTGSCGFGFVCPNRWRGELASAYDLVALSDKSPMYKGKSQCGQCLEVQCRSSNIRDGFGKTYDRKNLCKGAPGSRHVKVKVVDTCPCNYPGNAVSNSRWCCGDFPHLDMSQWALEKITSETTRYGVFAIKYRTVPCTAPIQNEAKLEGRLRPDPHAGMKPTNLDCASQGALTTEAIKKKKAVVPKKKVPTSSPKASAYRKAMAEARRRKCSATCYHNLWQYFTKYNPNMNRYDGKPAKPFNFGGETG